MPSLGELQANIAHATGRRRDSAGPAGDYRRDGTNWPHWSRLDRPAARSMPALSTTAEALRPSSRPAMQLMAGVPDGDEDPVSPRHVR